MITPEDYAAIADRVYNVDPLKQDPPITESETFHTMDADGVWKQEFVVIETETNPLTGFQGMAAVPVVDGEPDFSTVYIAFAGTNPDDRADIVADMVSVVGGNTGSGTQVADAERFAKRVEARLNEEGHSGAAIETVGHSLGGFLAMYVAAENQWKSTTFNGPDPWRTLSAEAKEWLEGERALGRRPFTNYVNQYDAIGNSLGHGTGAALFVADDLTRSLLDHHDLLAAFVFGPSGEMLRVTGSGLTMSELSSLMDSVSPGRGQALKVVDAVVSTVVGTAAVGAGAALSGLIVAVDTLGALALAATVGGVANHLTAIKDVNEGLVPEMTAGLTNAKNAAAQLYPWVTEADIEACVSKHDLQVTAHIDESAVAAVNDLVDDHLVKVAQIAGGVRNAVAKHWHRMPSGPWHTASARTEVADVRLVERAH